jgi:hypothetical protein
MGAACFRYHLHSQGSCPRHIEENRRAADLKLTADDIATLDAEFAPRHAASRLAPRPTRVSAVTFLRTPELRRAIPMNASANLMAPMVGALRTKLGSIRLRTSHVFLKTLLEPHDAGR